MTNNQQTLTLNFKPISQQQSKFFKLTKKEILLSGSVGAGKTLAGCWKGFLLNVKYPGNRGLIVRKEATTLEQSTKWKLLNEVIPPDMIVKIDHQKNFLIHKTSNPKINSVIVFSGLDKKADQSYPTKIASTEYGWIFFDETSEGDDGDYNVLLSRLRYQIKYFTPEQNAQIPRQLFGATNPDGPTHWLYKKFFEEKNNDREVILTSTYDNPTLPADYVRSLENSLTGIARERLLFGRWVQAEGIIFVSFDMSRNIIKKEQLLQLKDYKYFVFGADSNFPKPRACVFIGYTGREYHLIKEFYEEGASIERLIAWLTELKKQIVGKIMYGFHDPSDAQSIAKIQATGLLCDKANNNVLPGIDTVNNLFKDNQLLICNECINTIKEINGYHWKRGTKDTPEKSDDHAVDALRYAVHSDMNRNKPKPVPGVFLR